MKNPGGGGSIEVVRQQEVLEYVIIYINKLATTYTVLPTLDADIEVMRILLPQQLAHTPMRLLYLVRCMRCCT